MFLPSFFFGLRAWFLSNSPHSRFQAKLGRLYRFWRVLCANRMAMIGFFLVLFWLFIAIFADFLSPHSYLEGESLQSARLQPPSFTHWFGTDGHARDIYSRVLHGSRPSLFAVFMVISIVVTTGLLVGVFAGYVGGLTDLFLMRLTDIFLSFPRFILALALLAGLGPGMMSILIALALTLWPVYARIARSETLSVLHMDYIAAAHLRGGSSAQIIRIDLIPLCLSPVIVRATTDMSLIILMVGGLGFLGIGVQPPSPEWGTMIAEGRNYPTEYWWVTAIPGFALFTLSLGFNLLGDGLCAVLGPQERV
ncbi:MAG: ABC transporter permease [Alphaproteobacteria bacterium]|nr:ABC transporter permease [Alphaproteobacteria bacterium]